jgi:hypothetical protein
LGKIKVNAIRKWSISGSIQNAGFLEVGRGWQIPRGSKFGSQKIILNFKKIDFVGSINFKLLSQRKQNSMNYFDCLKTPLISVRGIYRFYLPPGAKIRIYAPDS